ncbi:uncharacterized protein K02A2.6-like isoform X2 [Nilaparvata lugens]|uniref:uncharacterized protein K02A2.6-like isoform X1 n=1 Tax=Nilaparvata lugens TaxID=108931 RepID=UPI00193E9253|nr:uncharacterized protein K02A2.6-like isoform X1 [Nilaparvata lugens]XP_039284776.1 uncharacterized protein K02A2.6-like isoform X2 [Nilaparvata lugens]
MPNASSARRIPMKIQDKFKGKVDLSMADMVHCVTENGEVEFSEKRLNKFVTETQNDDVLRKVIDYCENGWLNNIVDGGELRHFFKIRNEIQFSKGLLYYNARIIIPKNLRDFILNRLHETHLGETKMNSIASKYYYWPGIRANIKNLAESCTHCQKYRRSNVRSPMLSHEIPDFPFLKIGVDIAEVKGIAYLIVVDYYSRWLEITKMNSKTSSAVKSILSQLFGRFGIPQIIIADNNPFGSQEMIQFAKEWDFKIITISPRYSQSNGLAEKGVNIAKTMIRKCAESKTDLNLSLLNYRNSCVAGLNYSPAQLMFGRMIRTKFPYPQDSLKLHQLPREEIAVQMKNHKFQQKETYDKQSRKHVSYFKENQLMPHGPMW